MMITRATILYHHPPSILKVLPKKKVIFFTHFSISHRVAPFVKLWERQKSVLCFKSRECLLPSIEKNESLSFLSCSCVPYYLRSHIDLLQSSKKPSTATIQSTYNFIAHYWINHDVSAPISPNLPRR